MGKTRKSMANKKGNLMEKEMIQRGKTTLISLFQSFPSFPLCFLFKLWLSLSQIPFIIKIKELRALHIPSITLPLSCALAQISCCLCLTPEAVASQQLCVVRQSLVQTLANSGCFTDQLQEDPDTRLLNFFMVKTCVLLAVMPRSQSPSKTN